MKIFVKQEIQVFNMQILFPKYRSLLLNKNRKQIKYWVLYSNEVQNNKFLTPQHRNAATDLRKKDYKKEDIYEGQIMVTDENIAYFDNFLTTGKSLKKAVIAQYKIQKKIK